MIDKNFKLISKYALLLSAFYILEFALNWYVNTFDVELVTRPNQILLSYMLTFVLNIVTALIVYRDKIKRNTKTRYVILATTLYRPIGVVAFILYSIYCEEVEEEQTAKG